MGRGRAYQLLPALDLGKFLLEPVLHLSGAEVHVAFALPVATKPGL